MTGRGERGRDRMETGSVVWRNVAVLKVSRRTQGRGDARLPHGELGIGRPRCGCADYGLWADEAVGR